MSDSSSFHYDVVIAGGGFAGVYCARTLTREFRGSAKQRVALISDQNFLVFQPMLAEVAGSSLAPRHVVNPLRRLCPEVTVLRGAIGSIDLPGRSFTVEPGDFTAKLQIRFEHLVLAMGSVVDLSRVPGMPEHALVMKNVGDALKLRGAIIDRFEEANLEADPKNQARLLTIVVVGGGYSGVETAGQLLDLALEMSDSYSRIQREQVRVVLVHSGDHLLPEISASLGRYAEENLRRRGMDIRLNMRVTSMTPSKAMLSDGSVIETHTVISTVGNGPNPLITALCKTYGVANEKGRLITDDKLRVAGQERLWAAGDCAAVPMPPERAPKTAPSPFEKRAFCPPTAQFALRQGQLLGRNLAAVLGGDAPLKSFTFTGLGELAAIGHHAAVAEILGMQFQGFVAWWLWRSIYLMKLPGLERKVRVMLDWTLDLFFPRDIALFQPRPTKLIKEMHLEKGDCVFHAGDPANSLYIVKVGKLELCTVDGAVLRTLTAGHQLGKDTLYYKKAWVFTATACEPTTLVAVSAEVFETVTRAGATVDEVFMINEPEGKPAEAAVAV
ncbi:MAG TPA: FAD-dependent oxidoreductase [Chthoniobacteraceae bacterium]|nr:FAD-dependent oxidoreductase [Chthoniobacteraceae bacterium]